MEFLITSNNAEVTLGVTTDTNKKGSYSWDHQINV